MSQIDIRRGALVITLIEEYGFEADLAAKAALAAHPLDDDPVPGRAFERQVRKVSRQYGKVLRSLRGKPQEAEVLTLANLQSYKDLAIQHGEGHYINRYDKALNNEPPTIPPQLEADPKVGWDDNDLAKARRLVRDAEFKAESIRSELTVLKRDNPDDPRIQERTDALEGLERSAEDLGRVVSDADDGLIQIQPVKKEPSAEEHMRNFAEGLGLTVNAVRSGVIAVFAVELDDFGWETIEVLSTPSLPELPSTFVYKEGAREVRQLTPRKAMRMMQKAAKGL